MSEHQLQRKLDLSGRARQAGDLAEVAIADVLSRCAKVRGVEQVEELRTELKPGRLSPERKLLVQSKVEVVDRLCASNVTAEAAERLRRTRDSEGSAIKPG